MEQFGDGRFEVTATGGGPLVRDNKTGRTLLRDVAGWYEDGDRAFAVSRRGEYLVVDTEAGSWDVYPRLEQVPEEYQDAVGRIPRKAAAPPGAGA